MQVRTTAALDDKTMAKVQELIDINIDSYNGFNQAAKQIGDESLKKVFRELAEQRGRQARDLRKLFKCKDEAPSVSGSMVGRIRRSIMDWRDVLGGGARAVLKEVQRGEDYIKAKYEAALTQTAGTKISDMLDAQYLAVNKAHDRIRNLNASLAD